MDHRSNCILDDLQICGHSAGSVSAVSPILQVTTSHSWRVCEHIGVVEYFLSHVVPRAAGFASDAFMVRSQGVPEIDLPFTAFPY